ncbi:MAG TPA: response regulator transcription factor [Clostridia bacterium]|nr:response regulator transcription factor [Clostridia bacterium]
MINVMIVDDQEIITQGLKMILSQFENINVTSVTNTVEGALDKCSYEVIDVVLMDIKMPGINGIQGIKLIKDKYPNIEIIIFTTFKDDEFIQKGLSYGASGYLLKDATPEEIKSSIEEIHNGGAVIESSIAKKLIKSMSRHKVSSSEVKALTPRELEISILVGQGLNNKEISKILFLSEGTIKNHLSNIFSKLDIRDRTQLAIFVHENNLL